MPRLTEFVKGLGFPSSASGRSREDMNLQKGFWVLSPSREAKHPTASWLVTGGNSAEEKGQQAPNDPFLRMKNPTCNTNGSNNPVAIPRAPVTSVVGYWGT